MSEMKEPLVTLARLGAPHGVRGALSVSQVGEHLQRFTGKKIAVVDAQGKHKGDFTLSRVDGARVQFAELNDRDAAAKLTNYSIAAPLTLMREMAQADRTQAPVTISELWYFELTGLNVFDADTQQALGRISQVEDLGLNTVVSIEPVTGASLIAAPLEIPLNYPHWQKPDLETRSVCLAEWRVFSA